MNGKVQMSSFQTKLLRNVVLIDGTGALPIACDVLIEGDRISKIESQLEISAYPLSEVLDCEGLTLTPGFIDVHTHDDAQVLLNPNMLAKVSQGVTTVITGNCGLSLVPLVTQHPQSPLDLLHTTEFKYSRILDYAKAIESAKPSVNVGALIGHTTLRSVCMTDLEKAASQDEVDAMALHLDRALQDGALGLSSGLFYQPAEAANEEEMKALTRVVGQHGGVYVTHMRSEMDSIINAMHEAASTAQAGKVPWILSHHKCAGPKNWGRTIETLALLDRIGEKQEIPKNAIIFDLKGKYIYPSFIDIFCDYGLIIPKSDKKIGFGPQIESNTKGAYGWNQAIKSNVEAYKLFSHNNEQAEELKKNGVGAVLSSSKDGIVRGSGVLVNLNTQSKENNSIVIDKAAGFYSFSKGSSSQDYPSSLTGGIALLRQTFYDAIWYNKNKSEAIPSA